MTKYSEIEIETAKNLLEHGYKWIARNKSGRLAAHANKPSKVGTYWWSVGYSDCTCDYVPIFQSVTWDDKAPVSLESIVHPQILDDEERKYLSAFIKPFRNDVTMIRKDKDMACNTTRFRIAIYVSKSGYSYLPWFNSWTMYKGMEKNRKYTLEELGL